MHFTMLTAVDIPTGYRKAYTEEIDVALHEELADLKGALQGTAKDIISQWRWQMIRNVASPFGWAVQAALNQKLEPYYTGTDDEKYLTFSDEEEGLRQEYENGHCDCFRLPGGTITTGYESRGYPLVIKDGKVYQRRAGLLHHDMRTKKAKRMQALPNYPFKKLYADFDEYATKYCNMYRNEETGKYGYRYNPNGVFDAIELGGRWPFAFLVRDTCTEFLFGVRSSMSQEPDAPEGYRWVAAARKKDIAWEKMFQVTNESFQGYYDMLMRFLNGEEPPEGSYFRVEDGVVTQCGKKVVYKGESFRKFRRKYGMSTKRKYFILAYSLLDDDGYTDMNYGSESARHPEANVDDWYKQLDQFIDALPGDAVLARLDYHM